MPNDRDVKATINEAIERIKGLMLRGLWGEAHRACLEVLRVDPQNLKVIKIKNKIERIVQKKNRKSIKGDLKKLQPLWNEKKYEELLENLNQLAPYTEDYPPLRKIIHKAQHKYEKQISADQNQYFNETIAYIDGLKQQKKYEEAYREAERLKILNIHSKKIQKYIAQLRKEWIDHKIESAKSLLDSDKYEDIIVFLQGLRQIDAKSEKVINLINSVKKRYEIYKIEQKRDFIYTTLEKVRTLYQKRKYYKALQAAEVVIDIVPGNQKAKSLYLKSKKKHEKNVTKELFKQMNESRKQIENDRQKNKDKFVRI